MAKKKKKVKAGIVKRKQEKKHKLFKQKKAGQDIGKKLSMQKVQQAISKLALFVFEPEIEKITVSKEKISTIYQKKKEMPLQVMEFVDEQVYQSFLQALQDLLERKGNVDKLSYLGLQSALQFMQEDKYKQHMNQLVVGKYYCLLSQYGLITAKITPENILQVVGDYEKEYGKKLSHYQPPSIISPTSAPEITKELTPIEDIHNKVKERISRVAKQGELDLILEDIEIFFVDFLTEKRITEPEKITPLLLKSFVRYVKQNLNPTNEDLKNVTISLEYLQKALYYCKIFDDVSLEKASKIAVLEK